MPKEMGYARPVSTGAASVARQSSEDNWDLRWPQSIRTYTKMSREDSQVKSVLKAVIQPISRTPWRLAPNGADDEVTRIIAEDLNLVVQGEALDDPIIRTPRRASWNQHLRRALKWQLVYGHAFFELVFDDASATEDGLTHLRKIAPRHSDTISKINVASDGGLESIEQRSVGKLTSVTIPVDRLLAYRLDDDADDWVGESMLRAAYKHWRLKDQFLRLEATVLDRNGMGVPVSKSGFEPTDEDMQRLEDIVTGLRSGDYAGAVVKNDELLEIKGVSGQLVSPREAISYHDSQIARTALAHALNLDGKGGSYALAEVQMDLFFQSLNEIAGQMAETANQHLVRDMVFALTGDSSGPFPRIVFDTIEAKKSLSPQDMAALHNAYLLSDGPKTEAHIRRSYDLPAEDRPDLTGSPDPEEDT
ncbi:MAG: phage portal protein family protein [Brevibacterium linens]|uniref:phage portal protein family protein n=1 Tax=Corynebacterium variabile TaxID=1727 RepID=UPI003F93C6D4